MTNAMTQQLFRAIAAGDAPAVLAIVDAHPDSLQTVGFADNASRDKTPLMYALQCQQFDVARALMTRGADVRARMPGGPGRSVLHVAVISALAHGQSFTDMVDVAAELIERGADPNDALWAACHSYKRAFDRPEMIALLLARGADPDRAAGNSGNTVRELVSINAHKYPVHVRELFRNR